MQSQKREASNFYSSPLIQAEEKIQSGNFEPFLSHRSVWGAKTFVTLRRERAWGLVSGHQQGQNRKFQRTRGPLPSLFHSYGTPCEQMVKQQKK